MTPELEQKILKRLFGALSNEGLCYCVLRGFGKLPVTLGGGDLDLAVLPDKESRVASVVFSVLKDFGGTLVVDYKSSARITRFLGLHEGEWWGLAIDFFCSINYRGVEYVSTRDLIEHGEMVRGVRVASAPDVAMLSLVKELLANGVTRKDYLPKAVEAYHRYGNRSLLLLADRLSKESIGNLLELIRGGEEGDVGIVVKGLRRDVIKSGTLRLRIRDIIARYGRVIRPPGWSIGFLGVDGAGKTTLIDAVSPILAEVMHCEPVYEHLRPNWLPPLGAITGQTKKEKGPVTDPHGQTTSGFLGSWVRLAYYSVDYSLGYWKKVFPRLVKGPCIFVFDRYYPDFSLDPRRFRVSLPRWLIRPFFIFAPRPKLIFCLGGDPEAIYGRKPETELIDVVRQISMLKRYCDRSRRTVWVDTCEGIEESRSKILSVIADRFSKAMSGQSNS
jgi:thymidylate kinase